MPSEDDVSEPTFAEFLSPDATAAEWKEGFNRVIEQTALGPHDVSLVSVDDDGIVLEMPIGDHARQPFGMLHGGVSMLLAESAASMHACWGVDLSERVPVGIDINGSHLNSATQGTVRCRADVLKRGRTLIRHRVRVEHVETGNDLCEARVTNLYKSLP